MKKYSVLALSMAIALGGPGCAAFRANNLPVVTPEQLTMQSPKKVKVFSRWSIQTSNSMANDQTKAAGAAIHKDYFDKAIQESGCCDIVEGPSDADIVVSGTAYDHNNPAAMIPAVITGLSLYTIPSWVTAKVHISANAKTDTKETNYDVSDSMTMVQWLPMILAMPFTGSPITTGKEVDTNVYRNLVVQMREDGLFDKHVQHAAQDSGTLGDS